MSRPEPRSFGLSTADFAAVDRRERLFYGNIHFWGMVVGLLLGGLLLGLALGSVVGGRVGAGVGGMIGLFAGPILAVGPVEERLRKRDGVFQRYNKFKLATEAYDRDFRERQERERRTHQEFWRSLSGHAFERELAGLFRRCGLEVDQTPGSGDGGIDLIVRQAGRRIIVQCKQTRTPVGPAAARDLFGTLQHHRFDEGILATTAGATKGVYAFFEGKPLRVMDLDAILKLQNAHAPKG
jgi:hypothetical protein